MQGERLRRAVLPLRAETVMSDHRKEDEQDLFPILTDE